MKYLSRISSFLAGQRLLLLMCLFSLFAIEGWGTTTYKLTQVTSVSAGNRYVFVEDGYAFTTTGSNVLRSTNSYSTSSLTGSENYVYLLESSTNGYKLKNCSTATYLANGSSTNMSLNATGSQWTFSFTNGVALIQNYDNDNRFIGETEDGSHEFKAYVTSNLSTYPHDIYVYRLDEEPTCTSVSSIAGTFYQSGVDSARVTWTIPVDGSSNKKQAGVYVHLYADNGGVPGDEITAKKGDYHDNNSTTHHTFTGLTAATTYWFTIEGVGTTAGGVAYCDAPEGTLVSFTTQPECGGYSFHYGNDKSGGWLTECFTQGDNDANEWTETVKNLPLNEIREAIKNPPA